MRCKTVIWPLTPFQKEEFTLKKIKIHVELRGGGVGSKIYKSDSEHNSPPLFWNKNPYECICYYIDGWYLIK